MDRRHTHDPTVTAGHWSPPSLCSWEAAAAVGATLLAGFLGGQDEPDTSQLDADIAARNAEAAADQQDAQRRLEARRRAARSGGAFGRLLLTRGGERGLLG